MTVTKVRIKLEDVLGDEIEINKESLGPETVTTENFQYIIGSIKSTLQSPEKVLEHCNQRVYFRRMDEYCVWVARTIYSVNNWQLLSHQITVDTSDSSYREFNLILQADESSDEEDEDDIGHVEYASLLGDDFSNDRQDEENYDNYFVQASHYTHNAARHLLEKLIESSFRYGFSKEDIDILETILRVVSEPKKYRVNGYLYILVKKVHDEENHSYHELQIDDDGLKLSTGGYLTEDFGGDSYSDVIYPVDDEDDALNIVESVDNFVNEFLEQIDEDQIEVEVFDSGDGISELTK